MHSQFHSNTGYWIDTCEMVRNKKNATASKNRDASRNNSAGDSRTLACKLRDRKKILAVELPSSLSSSKGICRTDNEYTIQSDYFSSSSDHEAVKGKKRTKQLTEQPDVRKSKCQRSAASSGSVSASATKRKQEMKRMLTRNPRADEPKKPCNKSNSKKIKRTEPLEHQIHTPVSNFNSTSNDCVVEECQSVAGDEKVLDSNKSSSSESEWKK